MLLASCSENLDITHQQPAQAPQKITQFDEETMRYKDWSFKSLADETSINLRSFLEGKKLVMVVYFAPWCDNWWNEMSLVARLYDKYNSQGFGVIGVSEYASIKEAKSFLQDVPYTIVVESESRNDRTQTTHFEYRTSTHDQRIWGSPWHVFLSPQDLNQDGDILVQKAWTFSGELIESEVEAFIQQQLAAGR